MNMFADAKYVNRAILLLTWSLTILTCTHWHALGQQSDGPTPQGLLRSLSDQDLPAFEAEVQLPVGLLNHRADETWNTRINFDGNSRLHLGSLGIRYDQQGTLVLQNREHLLTPQKKKRHRWWIQGNNSAFVDYGTSTLSGVFGGSGSRSTDRVHQLLTVLYETQLLSDWADRTEADVMRSNSEDKLRLELRDAPDEEERTLVINVDREGSRVSSVRLIREFSPSYHRPVQKEVALRVDAFYRSGTLPKKLTYEKADGSESEMNVSYRRRGAKRSSWKQPLWASREQAETTASSTCPSDLFQIAREASFYRRSHFQKRLNVFGEQVDRIRTCFEERVSSRENGSVTGKELVDAIRYSRDQTYTPSGRGNSGHPTAFQTVLRMFRLEDQDRLTSKRLKGISLRPSYSTPIQLLAFRSALKSISSAASFSNQLERISQRYRLRTVRLFVREMEHRLRGIGEQDGVIQENGKEFLVSVQKEMKTSLPATLLMARLYRELGYFEKADAAHAALSARDELIPEVKGFIQTAQMGAARSLKALSIDRIDTRELLYLSGVQVKEEQISAARQTFQSFVDQYVSSDLTLFIDDVKVIRTVVESLLEKGHRTVVRKLFRGIIEREGGRFTGRSYLRPMVETLYGDTPEGLYVLFRHLRTPRQVSEVMHLETAVYQAQSRIEDGEADQVDYMFLARAIPELLSSDREGVDQLINQIKKGYNQFSTASILAERLGDLFWLRGDLDKACTFYRKAIQNRLTGLEEEPSQGLPNEVPSYGYPYQLLENTTDSPSIGQPLVIKYSLTAENKNDVQKARTLLKKAAQRAGKRESWMGIVRDPGIAANYERQYGAWGFYFLDDVEQAINLFREGIDREQGRFPYGSFKESSTYSLFRMHLDQNNETQALQVLRRTARVEQQHKKPFRFHGSAGQQYVRLLQSKKQVSDALEYLRDAAQREWRQISEFAYENSATEKLTNLLLKEDRVNDALQVLNKAFYRSLPESPSYVSGTAPYQLISTLKTHRHSIDALVVARQLSTIYSSDPEPLQNEIRNLQSRVSNANLMELFTERFRDRATSEVSKRTRQLLEKLVDAEPDERERIEKSILQRDDRIIPLLHEKWRNSTSNDLRDRLRSMIESRGWQYIRSLYERPDFLNE